VLRRHGFTATVFLPTDYIGNGRPTLQGKAHLTWDRVRELSAAGITFGSHTCSHPQLHDLGPEEITRELSTSKQTIESQLNVSAGQPVSRSAGQPRGVDSFCYPYKFPEHDIQFVSTLSKVLRSVGYDCCLSTRIGTTIPRMISLRCAASRSILQMTRLYLPPSSPAPMTAWRHCKPSQRKPDRLERRGHGD